MEKQKFHEKLFEHYAHGEPYIGCLHNHLTALNSYSNGRRALKLQKSLSDNRIRTRWLVILNEITGTISKAHKRSIQTTKQCFSAVTSAFVVYTLSYVQEALHTGKEFDSEAIERYLQQTSVHFKAKQSGCFRLLQRLVHLSNPNRITSIIDELRKLTASRKRNANDLNDTILTVAHCIALFMDLLLEPAAIVRFDPDKMFQLIGIVLDQLIGQHDYVKFCDQCQRGSGGLHELIDVVTCSLHLYEKFTENGVDVQRHWPMISNWMQLKARYLNELTCSDGAKQKAQANVESRCMGEANVNDYNEGPSVLHGSTSPAVPSFDFVDISTFASKHTCVVHKLFGHLPSNQWKQLLTESFYEPETMSWFRSLNLDKIELPAPGSCLCEPSQHPKYTQLLVKVAVNIFAISSNLQNRLRNCSSSGNIERFLDEDSASDYIRKAARVVDEALLAFGNGQLFLTTDEYNFCLRSIQFIKTFTVFVGAKETFVFYSLPGLTRLSLPYEIKLKVASIIADYSHEYGDQIEKLFQFFVECAEYISNEKPSETTIRCLAHFGLMYKRLADDEKGNAYLKSIRSTTMFQISQLKCLASVQAEVSGSDLATTYVKSIQVNDCFYRNENNAHLLVAALDAIAKAKHNSSTIAARDALKAFVRYVLDVCVRLRLEKQTVNLLLTLGSLQREQPDELWEIVRTIHQQLSIESICLGVPLIDPEDPYHHMDDCLCPMCTNTSMKLYIFRTRRLYDPTDRNELRKMLRFWKSKIENRVELSEEENNLRRELIERSSSLENVVSAQQPKRCLEHDSLSNSTHLLSKRRRSA